MGLKVTGIGLPKMRDNRQTGTHETDNWYYENSKSSE